MYHLSHNLRFKTDLNPGPCEGQSSFQYCDLYVVLQSEEPINAAELQDFVKAWAVDLNYAAIIYKETAIYKATVSAQPGEPRSAFKMYALNGKPKDGFFKIQGLAKEIYNSAKTKGLAVLQVSLRLPDNDVTATYSPQTNIKKKSPKLTAKTVNATTDCPLADSTDIKENQNLTQNLSILMIMPYESYLKAIGDLRYYIHNLPDALKEKLKNLGISMFSNMEQLNDLLYRFQIWVSSIGKVLVLDESSRLAIWDYWTDLTPIADIDNVVYLLLNIYIRDIHY